MAVSGSARRISVRRNPVGVTVRRCVRETIGVAAAARCVHLEFGGETLAALPHREETLARELALVYALRHAKVEKECEDVEREAKGDRPFQNGYQNALSRLILARL